MHLSFKEKLFFLFLLTMPILSCKRDDLRTEYTSQLLEKESFNIQLDSITPVDNTYFSYESINDSVFLFLTNSIYNSIDIYDRKTGNFYKRFVFKKEGPTGIAQIQGYTVVNEDSIFVFEKFHILNTKLINWKGYFVDIQPISFNAVKHYSVINHLSNAGGITYFDNNNLYFTTFSLLNHRYPDSYNPSIKFEYKYDLIQDSLSVLPFTYPESYWGKTQNQFASNPYRDKGKGLVFIYSWPKEPYLIKYNPATGESSIHQAHDRRINPLIPENMTHRDAPAEEIKIALEHSFYMRIIYDKFRDIYYRIAFLPIQFNKRVHFDYSANYERPFAVLVLNSKLEPIALKIFREKIYNPYSAFVGLEGLYFAKNNPNYKNLNENALEFTIFELR